MFWKPKRKGPDSKIHSKEKVVAVLKRADGSVKVIEEKSLWQRILGWIRR